MWEYDSESDMGAWGHGSFENDGAADWVYELEKSGDLSVVIAALEGLAEAAADEYVDVDVCQAAVAAAEVVAALTGESASGLPEEVAGWVEARREGGLAVGPEVVALAVRAL